MTDRRQARRPLRGVVAAALAAGCRWVSVREKDLPPDEQILLARSLLPLAHANGAKLMLHGEAQLAKPRRINTADRQHRYARGTGYFGETLAADLRAIARLAGSLESRARQHVVDLHRIDGFGFDHRMDRDSQQFVATDQHAGGHKIAA
ncbi:MAG: thiamine phosphate synthase [Xanthobacteraceae bacterium]